jgi:biotin carboxyl carrier protein
MNYEVNHNGHPFRVELNQENGSLTARVHEHSIQAKVRQPESGYFIFQIDERVYHIRVANREDGKIEVFLDGKVSVIQVLDRLRREGSAGAVTGPQPITSPMPGRVVRLLAQAGDTVEAGQGVVVVEAMKMQNEMAAPRSGKVSEIHVSEGQTVKAGEILAVVE